MIGTAHRCRHVTLVMVLILTGATFGIPVHAGDVQQRGAAYVIYLPADLDYDEVVERLKTEILAENWEITDVQDIGKGLRQYQKITQNKVISACKSQLLARAIDEDPFISLIVPCRFTAFRDAVADTEDYRAVAGKIVIGFFDPVAEAKALHINRYQAANQATEELKAVLQRIADFYQK